MPFDVLVEGDHEDGDEACLVTYWSSAEDPQTAIHQALQWVQHDRRLLNARLARVGASQSDVVSPGLFPTAEEGLYESSTRQYWERDPERAEFHFPSGVVPILAQGPWDPDDIVEGWGYGEPSDSERTFCAIAVVDGRRLLEFWGNCLGLFRQDSTSLEIQWHDGSPESSSTVAWRAEVPPRGMDFSAFLQLHQTHLIDSGMVELTMVDQSMGVMFRLTRHKFIQCLTSRSPDMNHVLELWESWGLALQEPLLCLGTADLGCHHYRPPGAMPRDELEALLQGAGFVIGDDGAYGK